MLSVCLILTPEGNYLNILCLHSIMEYENSWAVLTHCLKGNLCIEKNIPTMTQYNLGTLYQSLEGSKKKAIMNL